jgi:hypothetical protein
MTTHALSWLVTLFVLGLFLGTNLGVLVMAPMHLAAPDGSHQLQEESNEQEALSS